MSKLATEAVAKAIAAIYETSFNSEDDKEIYLRTERLFKESAHKILDLAHQKFGSLMGDGALLIMCNTKLYISYETVWLTKMRQRNSAFVYSIRRHYTREIMGIQGENDVTDRADSILNVLYTKALHDPKITAHYTKANYVTQSNPESRDRRLMEMYSHIYECPASIPYYESGITDTAYIKKLIASDIEPNMAIALGVSS